MLALTFFLPAFFLFPLPRGVGVRDDIVGVGGPQVDSSARWRKESKTKKHLPRNSHLLCASVQSRKG